MSVEPGFFHFESYALKPNPEAALNGRKSVKRVMAELVRQPHASPHVQVPQPPSILLGDPQETLRIVLAMAAEAKRINKRFRKDSHVMGAAVFSYPKPVEVVIADPKEHETVKEWAKACINWSKKEFGEAQVSCVVLHMDESNPHLHVIVLPSEPGAEPNPLRARAKMAVPKDTPKDYRNILRNNEFRRAGRELQDRYYLGVSVLFGHERVGMKLTRRKSPAERDNDRLKARNLKAGAEKLRQVQAELAAKEALLQTQRALLEQKELDLKELNDAVEVRDKMIATRERMIQQLLTRPAIEVVDGVLSRALVEIGKFLPEQLQQRLMDAARRAKSRIGMPDFELRASGDDLSDAKLASIVKKLQSFDDSIEKRATLVPTPPVNLAGN